MTTEDTTDTSRSNPVGQVLSETGKLAILVAPEQRPQLIVLIPILVFFQLLIFTSELSDGIKVLLSLSSSIALLWLAFFILPKQAKGVEALENKLTEARQQNQTLESREAELEGQVSGTRERLAECVTTAKSYLTEIENQVAVAKEHTQEEHTHGSLIEIQHYIDAKKREFDSALTRVRNAGDMIKTKKAAGADLAADFRALKKSRKNQAAEVSQDTAQ